MIYTITFNPALDYVLHISNLKLGTVHYADYQEIFWGGKGINVSTVLKELNLPSVALGFVAGFTGDALEKGLNEKGINTDFVHLKEGLTRINVKIKATEETDIDNYGPEINSDALDKLYNKLNTISDGDILVLAGSVPKSLPRNIYEEIIKQIADKNIKIVVDAVGELLTTSLKYKPFLVKPNNFELSDIIGKELKTIDEIADGATVLKNMGAQNVLVSMAGDGAYLIDEYNNEHYIKPPKGQVCNSVGAGDSMVAGFIAGYLSTKSYDYALKLGTACGSATTFSNGLATNSEIERLLNIIND